MADKISFKVDFAEFANYTGIVDGLGTSSLLKMDGFYKLLIQKAVPAKSKEGNPKFTLSCIVQDEDERNQTIISDVLAGGRDKNGNPNSHKLANLFESMGMTTQQVAAMASNGALDCDQVAATLTGKIVHASVEAESYNGNTSSRVRNFITVTKYTDAVGANTHRKPHKAQQSFTGTPAGVTTSAPTGVAFPATAATPAASGMFATGTPNGAAKVADPLARLSGLNLPV